MTEPPQPPAVSASPQSTLVDGRQSEAALAIQRGTRRLLAAHDFTSLTEFALPNGRRADIIALSRIGEVWIIEIKSSVIDFRTDSKWTEYQPFADRFWFAVAPEFPVDILPETAGLILADAFGAEIVRTPGETRLAAVRRKALTLSIARSASARLHALADPAFGAALNPLAG